MIRILGVRSFKDERGSLGVIESNLDIPFEIRRIYYLFKNCQDKNRGSHAHKKLKQVYIALSGSCVIEFDDGNKKFEYKLNNPVEGLYIDQVVWREIKNISHDCVLLVLADDFFQEKDYIRNYEEFINYIKNIRNDRV